MLPDLKHCQGEKDHFFSCNNNTRWTLGKKKTKAKKITCLSKQAFHFTKHRVLDGWKKNFIQTLGNVPSRYARNFLLVCYVSNKWKQKWVTKIELRISKSQEAFPHLFFLLGEEGELWGFFLDFNVPNVFPPSYGYPTQALNQNLSTNNDRHNSGIISFIALISLLLRRSVGLGTW